jgi:hypothetical protein
LVFFFFLILVVALSGLARNYTRDILSRYTDCGLQSCTGVLQGWWTVEHYRQRTDWSHGRGTTPNPVPVVTEGLANSEVGGAARKRAACPPCTGKTLFLACSAHTRSWDDINYAYSSTKLVCSKSSDHVVPTSGSGNLPSLRLSPIHRDTPEACVSLYSSQYTAAFSVGIGFPSISHYSYLIAMKPRRYKPCQLKRW